MHAATDRTEGSAGTRGALVPWVWLGGVTLLGTALAAAYWPCQLDDAFITYRFAANAARFGKIVYNASGPPVEGFTSPLWFVLQWLGALVGLSARGVAASLGFASYLGTLACVGSAAARLTPDVQGHARLLAAALSVTLIASSPGAQYYALTGLESDAFLCLCTLTTCGLAGLLPTSLGVVAAVLAAWTRPEAPVLIGVACLVALRHRTRARACGVIAVSLALAFVVLLITRHALFGEWLPNTYFAKDPDRMKGLGYVWDLLITPWASGLVALGVVAALLRRGWSLTFALAGLAWLVAAALEGGDWMPLGRFALPALACFAIAAAALSELQKPVARAALVVAIALMAVVGTRAANERIVWQHNTRRSLVYEAERLAAWLEASGARSVALMDIGEIGFLLPDAQIVDLAGLTDPRIARAQGAHLRKHLDIAYVLSEQQPDVVIARVGRPALAADGKIDADAVLTQPETDLVLSPQLAAHYRLEFAIVPQKPRVPFYGKLVFVRTDLQLPPAAKLPSQTVSIAPLAD